MKSVTFPQANFKVAENQEQYETLHVHLETKDMQVPSDFKGRDGNPLMKKQTVAWAMTACFELSEEEKAEILATGKIFYTQMLFGNNFHPVMMSTQNPFDRPKIVDPDLTDKQN